MSRNDSTVAYLGCTVLATLTAINPSDPPSTVDDILLEPGDLVLTPHCTDLEDRILWIVEAGKWRPHAMFTRGAVLPIGLTVRVACGTAAAGLTASINGRPPLIARRSDLVWVTDASYTESEYVLKAGRPGGQSIDGTSNGTGTLTLRSGSSEPVEVDGSLMTGDLIMHARDGSAKWRLVEHPWGISAFDEITSTRLSVVTVDPLLADALRLISRPIELIRKWLGGIVKR